MVPRLVTYVRPETIVSPCAAGTDGRSSRRTIAYGRDRWDETLVIFDGQGCAPDATLFTLRLGGGYDSASGAQAVAYRTVTPTANGSAYLQRQCGQYAWTPGVVQDLAGATCEGLASVPAP